MSDSIPHIPALRLGRTYESLEKIEVKDHRTGEVKAVVSTVNGGIVRRDLAKIGASREALARFTVAELMELSAKAGEFFMNGTLRLGDRGHRPRARRNGAHLGLHQPERTRRCARSAERRSLRPDPLRRRLEGP
jgi:hypothetical protein